MLYPRLETFFMLLCAFFFYRAGETDYSSGIPTAAASLALWLVAELALGWGVLGCLLAQAGLFAVLTAVNMLRNKPIA